MTLFLLIHNYSWHIKDCCLSYYRGSLLQSCKETTAHHLPWCCRISSYMTRFIQSSNFGAQVELHTNSNTNSYSNSDPSSTRIRIRIRIRTRTGLWTRTRSELQNSRTRMRSLIQKSKLNSMRSKRHYWCRRETILTSNWFSIKLSSHIMAMLNISWIEYHPSWSLQSKFDFLCS